MEVLNNFHFNHAAMDHMVNRPSFHAFRPNPAQQIHLLNTLLKKPVQAPVAPVKRPMKKLIMGKNLAHFVDQLLEQQLKRSDEIKSIINKDSPAARASLEAINQELKLIPQQIAEMDHYFAKNSKNLANHKHTANTISLLLDVVRDNQACINNKLVTDLIKNALNQQEKIKSLSKLVCEHKKYSAALEQELNALFSQIKLIENFLASVDKHDQDLIESSFLLAEIAKCNRELLQALKAQDVRAIKNILKQQAQPPARLPLNKFNLAKNKNSNANLIGKQPASSTFSKAPNIVRPSQALKPAAHLSGKAPKVAAMPNALAQAAEANALMLAPKVAAMPNALTQAAEANALMLAPKVAAMPNALTQAAEANALMLVPKVAAMPQALEQAAIEEPVYKEEQTIAHLMQAWEKEDLHKKDLMHKLEQEERQIYRGKRHIQTVLRDLKRPSDPLLPKEGEPQLFNSLCEEEVAKLQAPADLLSTTHKTVAYVSDLLPVRESDESLGASFHTGFNNLETKSFSLDNPQDIEHKINPLEVSVELDDEEYELLYGEPRQSFSQSTNENFSSASLNDMQDAEHKINPLEVSVELDDEEYKLLYREPRQSFSQSTNENFSSASLDDMQDAEHKINPLEASVELDDEEYELLYGKPRQSFSQSTNENFSSASLDAMQDVEANRLEDVHPLRKFLPPIDEARLNKLEANKLLEFKGEDIKAHMNNIISEIIKVLNTQNPHLLEQLKFLSAQLDEQCAAWNENFKALPRRLPSELSKKLQLVREIVAEYCKLQ